MKMRWQASLVTLALCSGPLTGCGGGDDPLPVELPFDRVREVTQYGAWPEQGYAFSTDAQWAGAWAAYTSGRALTPAERPAVDFSRRNLLGISRGWGNNGCWGLNITRVLETATQIRVEYRQSKGPARPDMLCTQSLVPMADFVTVPKSDKPVVYAEVTP